MSSKILSVDDLIGAANAVDLSNYHELLQGIEQAVANMANAIAEKLDVDHTDTSFQGAFGGLCSTFEPKHEGQPCPPDLDDADPHGDWE